MKKRVIERHMFYGTSKKIFLRAIELRNNWHKCKLAIEVDGEIHLQEEILEYDDGRSHDIEKPGIKILRFTNKEIIENIESVKEHILYEINSLSPL
jgi:very-short-patch-repair endonuclease